MTVCVWEGGGGGLMLLLVILATSTGTLRFEEYSKIKYALLIPPLDLL